MALELWSQDLLLGRSVMADRAHEAGRPGARPLGALMCHCGYEVEPDAEECRNCGCIVGDERGMCRSTGDPNALSDRILNAVNEVYGSDATDSDADSLTAANIVGGDPSQVRFHA